MLRMILGARRRVETVTRDESRQIEPWTFWIKRAIAATQEHMRALGLDSWVQQFRRQKWRWADELVRNVQGKWSLKAVNRHLSKNVRQSQQRAAQTCWDDCVTAFAKKLPGDSTWRDLMLNSMNGLHLRRRLAMIRFQRGGSAQPYPMSPNQGVSAKNCNLMTRSAPQ